MMNVLVTGASGQLASEIREISGEYGYNFFFTTRYVLDITKKENIENYVRENNITHIINCAAYTAVDSAENESENANKINSFAVENLVDVCEKYNIELVHISTDYVFDGNSFKPYSENDLVNPIAIYGESKLLGELAISKSNIKKATIIRTSWVYSFYGKNFVKTMLNLFNTKNELSVICDQVGTPTYAKDLARFILDKLCSFKNGINIYHYSNEGVCSWYDFAYMVNKLSGNSCNIKPIKTSEYQTLAKRPYYSVLDKSKVKQEFNLEISHWSVGLIDCLKRLGF